MIAREGIPFVIGASVLAAVMLFIPGPYGWLFFILPAFVVYFFRDPERVPPEDEAAIVSPADGRVIEVAEVEEGRYLKKRMRKIVIFLSIFNVHVNRIPFSGRVRSIRYHPGKFLIGFHPKASLDNEQNAVILDCGNGQEILFIQIAGLIARRIICYLTEGDEVVRGRRFGLIRFGSRMDIYLPLSARTSVQVGDRVKGGESILGRLS